MTLRDQHHLPTARLAGYRIVPYHTQPDGNALSDLLAIYSRDGPGPRGRPQEHVVLRPLSLSVQRPGDAPFYRISAAIWGCHPSRGQGAREESGH